MDKTIDDLLAAEAVTADDLFVVQQNATAKKVSGDTLRRYVGQESDLPKPDGADEGAFLRVRGKKWVAETVPAGGTDISLGLTAATVGQTIKVKAVDTDGKPTAWEAVDMGGGETWELIASGEMQETAALTINKDNNGLPISLKSAQIFVRGDISVPKSSTMRVSAERFGSSKDYDSYSVEVPFRKDNPKVNLWYVLREKTMPMLFGEEAPGSDWQSADCQVLMGIHRHHIDTENIYGRDPLNHLINKVSIGHYMGTGNMAAGCKYEIWGVRA